MRQLGYQVYYTRYHVSLFLSLIGSVLKHCKVSRLQIIWNVKFFFKIFRTISAASINGLNGMDNQKNYSNILPWKFHIKFKCNTSETKIFSRNSNFLYKCIKYYLWTLSSHYRVLLATLNHTFIGFSMKTVCLKMSGCGTLYFT